ncbi:MAG: DEAD/DEAH box helicase [Thermoguttaceae bacterium]|jgi:non-specific serine/threonine protein kinase|nr:DEAD/DEAH box helicase [Thermoguttaceae bacterium]
MELAFSPQGRITAIVASDAASDASPLPPSSAADPGLDRVVKAFAAGQAEGLWALATERFAGPLAPSVAFWRDFAGRYVTELCHTPEVAGVALGPIPPPDAAELAAIVVNAPPMQGAEYLAEEPLARLWSELDQWVRREVAAFGELAEFLRQRAPLWHQVGRVCFHLAENRRDEANPFAFLATYAASVGAGGRIRYQPLSGALREFAGVKNKKALLRLLSPIHAASQKSALVKDLVESGDIYQPLAWTPREAYRFLQEAPLFEECGIVVRLPDWWKKRPRPRITVTIGDRKQPSLGAEHLLDFRVQRALGDLELTEAEWRELMSAEDGLVLLRGQWVEVDRQKLKEALDHWKRIEQQAQDGVSFIQGMRLLAGVPADLDADEGHGGPREWAFVRAGQWLGDVLAKLRDPAALGKAQAVPGLQTTLRPYQQLGVDWLRFLTRLGLGACLADDMGLGKTIQVLGLLLALKHEGAGKPSLLVLPASLLANWKAEIARFAPALRARFVHPSEDSGSVTVPGDCPDSRGEAREHGSVPFRREGARPRLEHVDVVLTTYGMLLRQEWLFDVSWRLVVLDEAQAIKNPTARQTKAAKRLKAEARIALTGTPVENRLGDLWSLFDFLNPGLLGSQTKFKEFVKRLGSREENRYGPLRNLVKPYILRRLKTDRRVIDDLPDKTEVRAWCNLSKRQAALYAKLVEELSDALKGTDGMKRRGLVLAYLMRLKQLCNHPSQLAGDGRFAPHESGKFARLAEICDEIASRQEKALVFTQFREMTEPLAGFLAGIFGRPGLVLHGSTAVGRRKALVDAFQRDDGPPFFVLSLKAGGTGLNLTAASHVIHFDRWWNPAVENQATDRAFRIGQRRNVLVHKFVCRGTVEERIDAMIEEKTQLASEILEGGAEKMLTEMTDAELIRFVSLDVAAAASEDAG